MANKIAIYPAQINFAINQVSASPSLYVGNEVARAKATRTPGRYLQRSLVAGRASIANALFEVYPALNGDYHKLTKAIRAGHDGDATDFNAINARGAVALGLISEEKQS